MQAGLSISTLLCCEAGESQEKLGPAQYIFLFVGKYWVAMYFMMYIIML